MKAYLLPTGEILHPIRIEGDGLLGDGMDLAAPESSDFKQWEPFAVPAPASALEAARRIRSERARR